MKGFSCGFFVFLGEALWNTISRNDSTREDSRFRGKNPFFFLLQRESHLNVTSTFSLGFYVKTSCRETLSLFIINNKEPIELLFFCATHSNKSEAMRVEWEGHPWAMVSDHTGPTLPLMRVT